MYTGLLSNDKRFLLANKCWYDAKRLGKGAMRLRNGDGGTGKQGWRHGAASFCAYAKHFTGIRKMVYEPTQKNFTCVRKIAGLKKQ